jgi:glycosyltransferase involved in cell wall biosynthesis
MDSTLVKYNCLIDLSKLKNLFCGLGQYSKNLGKSLDEINDTHLKFNFLLPQGFENDFPNSGHELLSLKRRYFPNWSDKYDLWHSVHQNSPYFPSDNKTPYILTIHDLNFLEEKSPYKAELRKQSLQKRIDRASAITTISQFTADKVNNLFDLKSKSISVIYNGVEVSEFPDAKKPDFVPNGDFLFTLGVVKKKKNFKSLIGLLSKIEDVNLVIAGDKSDSYAGEILIEAKAAGLADRVILPGKISDKDKYWYFKNCKAFVFPSMLEGFGLPVIEAMRFGKPVFLSKYSSLPEIGAEEAYYWDDFDHKNMADLYSVKMLEYQNDINKVQGIIKHSQKFNWKNAAEEYVEVYKSVLNVL